MSTITQYMSLTAWTSPNDPYNHGELANNFDAIDKHRHVPGEGRQLVTDSYTDRSVTKQKLAEPAVDTDNLYDGSVTVEKLAGDIFSRLVPLGVVFPWWARNASATPVYGPSTLFELCDGRTITDHDMGGGPLVLPNLINRFISFSVLANVGVTGGSQTVSLSHSHTVNPHQHVVPGHTHGVNGVIGGGNHQHSFRVNPLNMDDHLWFKRWLTQERFTVRTYKLRFPNSGGTLREGILGVQEMLGTDRGTETVVPMVPTIDGTTSDAPHSHPINLPTDASQRVASEPASAGTDSQLGNVDVRPPFVTMVPVMRVRNP
jgi:hypothetical protein